MTTPLARRVLIAITGATSVTAALRDQVVGGYVRELDDLEFSTATYVTQAFPRHFHDTYSISVVEHGAGAVWCEGTNYALPPDGLTLINPGQVHTGGVRRRGTPMHYRVLYPSVGLIERLTIGRRTAPPAFRIPSVVDTDTARRLSRVHRLLPDVSRSLERDELLIDALTRAFAVSGTPTVLEPGRGSEPIGIRRVLEYLHAHATEPVSLTALASSLDWTPAHLSRAFRKHVGMPPYAYLLQLRIAIGRRALADGASIAAAALAAGFADQSHFTREFRRRTGSTPGAYQARIHLRTADIKRMQDRH
jgi:AraC-like DNA-binding protein